MLTDRVQYKQGRATELALLSRFNSQGWQAEDRSGGKAVDLLVTWPMFFSIEVKDEDRYAESPNICVEIFQGEPPHPSGIAASKALFAVHTLGPRCIVYAIPRMQEYVRRGTNAGYLKVARFRAADYSNGGVVVARAALKQHTAWVDDCPRDYVLGAIDNLITRLMLRIGLEDAADDYARRFA